MCVIAADHSESRCWQQAMCQLGHSNHGGSCDQPPACFKEGAGRLWLPARLICIWNPNASTSPGLHLMGPHELREGTGPERAEGEAAPASVRALPCSRSPCAIRLVHWASPLAMFFGRLQQGLSPVVAWDVSVKVKCCSPPPNRSTTQQKLGRGRLGLLQALRLARPRMPRGLHGNPCPPRPQQADSHHPPRPPRNYTPQKALRGGPPSQRAVRLPLPSARAVTLRRRTTTPSRLCAAALPAAPRFASAPVPGGSFPLLAGGVPRSTGQGRAAVVSPGLGQVREVPERRRPLGPSVLCAAPQQRWRRPRGRGGSCRPGSGCWLWGVSRAKRRPRSRAPPAPALRAGRGAGGRPAQGTGPRPLFGTGETASEDWAQLRGGSGTGAYGRWREAGGAGWVQPEEGKARWRLYCCRERASAQLDSCRGCSGVGWEVPDPGDSVGSSHQREGIERRGLEGLGISLDGVILTLKRCFLRVLDQRRHP